LEKEKSFSPFVGRWSYLLLVSYPVTSFSLALTLSLSYSQRLEYFCSLSLVIRKPTHGIFLHQPFLSQVCDQPHLLTGLISMIRLRTCTRKIPASALTYPPSPLSISLFVRFPGTVAFPGEPAAHFSMSLYPLLTQPRPGRPPSPSRLSVRARHRLGGQLPLQPRCSRRSASPMVGPPWSSRSLLQHASNVLSPSPPCVQLCPTMAAPHPSPWWPNSPLPQPQLPLRSCCCKHSASPRAHGARPAPFC
jgi:hypothetical protein